MVRRKIKWKSGFLFYILVFSVFTKSLPIEKSAPNLPTIISSETVYSNYLVLRSQPVEISDAVSEEESEIIEDSPTEQQLEDEKETTQKTVDIDSIKPNAVVEFKNATRSILRQLDRPGQAITRYDVIITAGNGVCSGIAEIQVELTFDTREDPISLFYDELDIQAVKLVVGTDQANIGYDEDDGILYVFPENNALRHTIIVEYNIPVRNDGTGIFESDFNGHRYLGMNLYPTYARRVFPCNDELTEEVPVSFTFNGLNFVNMASNTLLEENSVNQFRSSLGRLHLWGMIAHDFNTVLIPVPDVHLFGRAGLNQDALASTAIQYIFNTLTTWINKNYFEIMANQDSKLSIVALTENSVDWNALSTICIWEPYIYIDPNNHSAKQRFTSFVKIAESLARQWFGFVVFPQNWRHQWVLTGLTNYAAYDIVNSFQTGIDINLLDMDTLLVTEVIQESLLRDAYETAMPLLPEEDIFDVNDIRGHIHGLIEYKSTAILRMLRLILGDMETDYIKLAAQRIIDRWPLQPQSSFTFIDALREVWQPEPNKLIDDIEEYVVPWTQTRGYPLIHVGTRQGGLLVTQEHFAFTDASRETYSVPLTFTTSMDMDFSNIRPITMMDNTMTISMALDEEEDFVLFNIQGQGYYRVDYDLGLWENIIEALGDPERRQQIHPLNRATLIDDSLNLARARKLDYDIAFRVVLTMENDFDYAPWRAFVRNMDFLRKRLVAFVTDDEELDPDIYLRMVRRTIGAFEAEIGFYPDTQNAESAMTSLTRGLVMVHACRANYQPCIAAAMDWFFDPDNNEPVVNPNIPSEIRPAVYCTMVREGDPQVVPALYARLEIEPVQYERVVILESLACSRDGDFINTLLFETIADNSPYAVEERFRIFKAVVESSYENAMQAIAFIRLRTIEIRNKYGGSQKLEELIYILAENAANEVMANDLRIWVESTTSNLFDSEEIALRILSLAQENVQWDTALRDAVYEWIDENDAPKMAVSLALMLITLFINLFNY